MPLRLLSQNELASVSIDEERGIVLFVRSDVPLDPEALEPALEKFNETVPLHQRGRLALLFDMRKAPYSRPELEDRLSEFASGAQRGFIGCATVVATAVGKLQATRIRREGKIAPVFLTSSIEEAYAHLENLVRDRRASKQLRGQRRTAP